MGDTVNNDPPQGTIAVFRNNGNVGIGTNDPDTLFHVEGTTRLNRLEFSTGSVRRIRR